MRDWDRERIIDDLVNERRRDESAKEFEGILFQYKHGYISEEDYKLFLLGEKDFGVKVINPTLHLNMLTEVDKDNER